MKKNFLNVKFQLKYVRYIKCSKINLNNLRSTIKAENVEYEKVVDQGTKQESAINAIKKNIKLGDAENVVNIDYVASVEKIEKIKLLKMKNLKLIVLCFIASTIFYCTVKKVPEGYICLLENINDKNVLPYIYDDKMTFLYNPFKYKIVHMRIVPIQKKYTNVYETVDKKKIKVTLEVKLKPKIPFIIEIYNLFGVNYSSKYIEREMDLDIKSVVKNYNYDLFLSDEKNCSEIASAANEATTSTVTTNAIPVIGSITVDDVVDQIMERLYDCSIFHKIILLDATIIFDKVDNNEK